MRWIPRSAVALMIAVALVACGPGAAGEAYEDLQRRVAEIRESAEARDETTTAQRIAELRAQVAQLSREGVIGQPDAERILTAASGVEANLGLIAPPPPPPPAPVPPPLEIQVPGSNAGGSVAGSGERGERGEPGERGRGRDSDDDNNDIDSDDDD